MNEKGKNLEADLTHYGLTKSFFFKRYFIHLNKRFEKIKTPEYYYFT